MTYFFLLILLFFNSAYSSVHIPLNEEFPFTYTNENRVLMQTLEKSEPSKNLSHYQNQELLLKLILSVLLLAAIGFLIKRYLIIKAPPLTAKEKALKKFKSLSKLKTPEQKYTEIVSILRSYIEQTFGIMAPYLTTKEYVKMAANHDFLKNNLEIKSFFEFADSIKFAKNAASDKEVEKLKNYAISFIDGNSQSADPSGYS